MSEEFELSKGDCGCLIIALGFVFLLVVLFGGEPDLMDAIVEKIRSGA